MARSPPPTTRLVLPKSRPRSRAPRVGSTISASCRAASTISGDPDARIEPGVRHVRGERQQHVEDREQKHHGLGDRQVLVGDALIGEVAEPIESEDGLDYDRAAKEE